MEPLDAVIVKLEGLGGPLAGIARGVRELVASALTYLGGDAPKLQEPAAPMAVILSSEEANDLRIKNGLKSQYPSHLSGIEMMSPSARAIIHSLVAELGKEEAGKVLDRGFEMNTEIGIAFFEALCSVGGRNRSRYIEALLSPMADDRMGVFGVLHEAIRVAGLIQSGRKINRIRQDVGRVNFQHYGKSNPHEHNVEADALEVVSGRKILIELKHMSEGALMEVLVLFRAIKNKEGRNGFTSRSTDFYNQIRAFGVAIQQGIVDEVEYHITAHAEIPQEVIDMIQESVPNVRIFVYKKMADTVDMSLEVPQSESFHWRRVNGVSGKRYEWIGGPRRFEDDDFVVPEIPGAGSKRSKKGGTPATTEEGVFEHPGPVNNTAVSISDVERTKFSSAFDGLLEVESVLEDRVPEVFMSRLKHMESFATTAKKVLSPLAKFIPALREAIQLLSKSLPAWRTIEGASREDKELAILQFLEAREYSSIIEMILEQWDDLGEKLPKNPAEWADWMAPFKDEIDRNNELGENGLSLIAGIIRYLRYRSTGADVSPAEILSNVGYSSAPSTPAVDPIEDAVKVKSGMVDILWSYSACPRERLAKLDMFVLDNVVSALVGELEALRGGISGEEDKEWDENYARIESTLKKLSELSETVELLELELGALTPTERIDKMVSELNALFQGMGIKEEVMSTVLKSTEALIALVMEQSASDESKKVYFSMCASQVLQSEGNRKIKKFLDGVGIAEIREVVPDGIESANGGDSIDPEIARKIREMYDESATPANAAPWSDVTDKEATNLLQRLFNDNDKVHKNFAVDDWKKNWIPEIRYFHIRVILTQIQSELGQMKGSESLSRDVAAMIEIMVTKPRNKPFLFGQYGERFKDILKRFIWLSRQ